MTDTATTYDWLKPDDYLRHLRADTDRILDVAARRPDAEVPLCPGWTVRDAVEHTGSVFSHKVAVHARARAADRRVASGRTGRPTSEDADELVPGAPRRAASTSWRAAGRTRA